MSARTPTAQERASGLVQRTRCQTTGTVVEVWRPGTVSGDHG